MRDLIARWLYPHAATWLSPCLRVALWRRARCGKEVRARLPERYGHDRTVRPAGPLLWAHAASVGEAISVLPVIAALDPVIHVLLTTGTVTSGRLLDRRLPALGLDARVLHRFAPLDVPGWVGRFLDHWRPDAAVFVESELWPNMLAACCKRAIPTALINARMSETSAARWRRAPRFAHAVLSPFSYVQARHDADAARLRGLGVRRIDRIGDLKFAAEPLAFDATELAALKAGLGDRPVWLAASTHAGEEAIVAEAHRLLASSHPNLLTIIVPRHPERGMALCAQLGATRRIDGPPRSGLWIVDTIGELGLFYRLCRVVLIGKSLCPPGGGQNLLEPALLGCAVAAGPHMGNFQEATTRLEAAGVIARVQDAGSLAVFVGRLLSDPAEQRRMGQAAQECLAVASDLPVRIAMDLKRLIGALHESA